MAGVCPHCGQRMLVRHGVRLSPLLADLFDMIARSEAGVEAEVLAGVFYPGKARAAGLRTLRVNIHHLNDRLVETDFRVHATGPYRLQRRK